MIKAMNGSGVPVIAVDLPSGVNGTTGAVMGVAVQARHTVTFFRKKTGHLLLRPTALRDDRGCRHRHPGPRAGEDQAGHLDQSAAALGSISFRCRPPVITNIRVVMLWSSRRISTTGAARLAARGALRAGAGLVTIASPSDALAVNAASNLAVMVREVAAAAALGSFLADRRRNAVLLGPGGGVGQAMRDQVQVALASEAAVVLDADALTSFAEDPEALETTIGNRAGRATVLTPHQGEFSRLFRLIESDPNVHVKLEKARAAARLTKAVVLFQGRRYVVAAPDGRACIADNAPPTLATAGSGDVLAGMIAGLLGARHAGLRGGQRRRLAAR